MTTSKDITSAMLFQADMLQLKLLGILVHFDNHLNNGTITIKEKKQVDKCVIKRKLSECIDPHV